MTTHVKPLQATDVHHIVGRFGHHLHNVHCLPQRFHLVRQPRPFRILEHVPQQQLILHDPLNGLDQDVAELQLVAQELPHFLKFDGNDNDKPTITTTTTVESACDFGFLPTVFTDSVGFSSLHPPSCQNRTQMDL